MKRRNVESNKYRKQFHFRKCKFTEGMYGTTFLYLKFLLIWSLIMIADFLIDFRFEFLWPLWLFMRSIYDSFKYQGLIFSLFFALIAFLSDLFCYMFIPVQWLFFASSTYVWVQYVWHTGFMPVSFTSSFLSFCNCCLERGICLPTILLWLLFVYIEASLRIKGSKPGDLCRPFAAHCIGYPMVTLGFGFKSYLGFKWRLRKQKDVREMNKFYMQLLLQALPVELQQQITNNDEKYLKTIQGTNDEDSANDIQQPPPSTAVIVNNSSLIQNLKEKCLLITNNNNSTKLNNGTAALTITYPTNDEDLPYIQQKQENPQQTGGGGGGGNNKYKSHNNNNNNGNLSTTASINGLAQLFNTNAITCDFVQPQQQQQQHQNSDQHSQTIQHITSKNKKSNFTSNVYQQNKPTPITPAPTSAICSSINANHTNININMTINTTAIATATTQNTSTQPQQHHQPVIQQQQNNSKKKNKDKSNNNNGQEATVAAFAAATQTTSTNGLTSTTTSTTTTGQQTPANSNRDSFLVIERLEDDVKKLQQELQQQKDVEQYLRNQINYFTKCDRNDKLKLEKLQQEKDQLQIRLQKTSLQNQKDKDELLASEKRLQEEKRLKTSFESQLSSERKLRETQEKIFSANTTIKNSECSDGCKQRAREYENDTKSLVEQLNEKHDRMRSLEMEIKSLLKYRETQNSLVSALNILEEKNSSLQDSLSAEKRFKMDLLSALGETRRQLEAALIQLDTKEKEINTLKVILKNAITENNHYLQTDLLAQLLTSPQSFNNGQQQQQQQQHVNNFNNSNNQRNSINTPSPTPNLASLNMNNNNSNSNSHCNSPHQPIDPIFTSNV